eukprot:Skav236162  [mRNA]  locus=scaffold298:50225:52879:+ [translate_table: standard]
MTELQQCERTRDVWLSELQEQLRAGQLTDDNHAFLHGNPTTVPGSWTNGQLECKSSTCAALAKHGASSTQILAKEGAVCKADRRSRRLVAENAADPRFVREFQDATAIFSTNDLKYHVNKRRAVAWAAARGQQLQIAVAQDIASATVVHEKPDLPAEKMQWLQRHDKECGALYGVLPLCIGMPVRATDHLDRKHGILKGCKGTVVGWSACKNVSKQDGVVIWNQLPHLVFVKFDTGTSWQIDGVPEPNVFPVAIQKHAWFLDYQRKHPKLRIWRQQFPLAPGFAITAHVAQGQTLPEGVIADLTLGYGANPFTAFVAVTRVKGRERLLIFRPFDAKPFQRGVGLGRELLLRHLRRETIDWKALLAKYCEERACASCTERKNSAAYTVGQWKRADADRVCRECCQRHAAEGCPWQCHVCKVWHPEANFPAKHRQRQCSFYRVCLTCETLKACHRCGLKKPESAFGLLAWKARNADRRICRLCASKQRGHWKCTVCKELLPISSFGAEETCHGKQQCKNCAALAVVVRFTQSANARLRRTRIREVAAKHAKVIAEVRREIAQRVAHRQSAPPTHAVAGNTNETSVSRHSSQAMKKASHSPKTRTSSHRTRTCPASMQKRFPSRTDRREALNAHMGTNKRKYKRDEDSANMQHAEPPQKQRKMAVKAHAATVLPNPKAIRETWEQIANAVVTPATDALEEPSKAALTPTPAAPSQKNTLKTHMRSSQKKRTRTDESSGRQSDGSPRRKQSVDTSAASKATLSRKRAANPSESKFSDVSKCRADTAGAMDASQGKQLYVYVCPHCRESLASNVATGCVNHRAHCGKQFNVQNGNVRDETVRTAAQTYNHRCPQCGVRIQSRQPHGRIRCVHKNPNGRTCRCAQWTVKL